MKQKPGPVRLLESQMSNHHYTECGLQNVFIEGLTPVIDDDGDEIITIPAINELHHHCARHCLP